MDLSCPQEMQYSGNWEPFLVVFQEFKLQFLNLEILSLQDTPSSYFVLKLYWGSPLSVKVIVSLVTSRACKS